MLFRSPVLATMTRVQKSLWSSQGVVVTEVTRAGTLAVCYGTSTDPSSIQVKEVSLVRAKDKMIQLIEDTFDSTSLIGDFIDSTTTLRVQGVVMNCLQSALGLNLIVNYNGVKVRIRPGAPQVVEVKFQYQPAYPLNFIVVSFSINTVTGETTALDLAV